MTAETHPYSAPTGASTPDHSLTLRRAFKTNATLSLLTGLLFALDSAQVAHFLSIDRTTILNIAGPGFILELGIVIILFAGWVAFTATRPTINRRRAIGILVGDCTWVVASVALILTGAMSLTTAGGWTVLIAADIVLAIAIWEFVGIRRMAKP